MMARRPEAQSTLPGGRQGGAGAPIDLGQVGAMIVLAAALTHAVTMYSSLPWWDMSPLIVTPSMSGMGPAQSLVTDAVLLAGAVLVFIGQWRCGARLHVLPLALAAVGLVGVGLHGWVLPTSGLANLQLGATWAAGVVAALAMLHACRDGRTRRLTVAVLVGFVALLAIKGFQQRFIEHPRTVENYARNREQILAAQGWTAGSPMALGYERRLKQSDPTAWFGLSNVYASFMAAGASMLAAALLTTVRCRVRAARWILPVVALVLATALAALALTYSKGGIGALALGLAAYAGAAWLRRPGEDRRRDRVARFVLLAAVAAPILAVVLRGPMGEQLGDRSLLFRWYYWQGAARIFAAHPVTGVGPAGFQEAYLSARPPLSVEEVTSPHGLPFDYLATLGIFGFAFIGFFGVLVWRITAPLPRPTAQPDSRDPASDRQESRLGFLVAGVVALLGTWLDMQVVLPHGSTVTLDRAAVWVVGLLAWWTATGAFLRLGRGCPAAPALALVAGSIVLAIHAQIEVTPVQTGSATLFFVVLGAAAARPEPGSERRAGRATSLTPLITTLAAGMLTLLIAGAAWRASTWQHHLREGAAALAPISDIRARLTVPAEDPDAARHRAEALTDLGRWVGRPVNSPEPWLTLLQLDRTPAAVQSLQEAAAMFPDQWRLSRAAAWLLLEAAVATRHGPEPDSAAGILEKARQSLAPEHPDQAATGHLRAYAALLQRAAELTDDRDPLEEAVPLLETVAERDPWNLPLAVELARLHETLGHPEQAAQWARRALELEAFKRLDAEVHGLSQPDREAMRRLAGP